MSTVKNATLYCKYPPLRCVNCDRTANICFQAPPRPKWSKYKLGFFEPAESDEPKLNIVTNVYRESMIALVKQPSGAKNQSANPKLALATAKLSSEC